MKLIRSFTIAVILALTIPAFSAAAATPLEVTIVSEMWLSSGSGTFEATGPAVDAGIVCPAGTVTDSNFSVVGWQSNQVQILFVHKQFVCNDGSGSFDMNLNVRVAPTGVTARWIVVGGEGPYMDLAGNGGLTAEGGDVPDLLIDTYSGKMHIK